MATETKELFNPKEYLVNQGWSIQATVRTFLNYCQTYHEIIGKLQLKKYQELVSSYCHKNKVDCLEDLSQGKLVEFADVLGDYFKLPNGGSEERERKILRSGLATIFIDYHNKNKPIINQTTPNRKPAKSLEDLTKYTLPAGAIIGNN